MAVKVGSFAKSTGAATVSQAITGVGFKPRALILWTDGSATSDDGWSAGYRAAIGFAARNAADTITVGSQSGASEDNAATSNASKRSAANALTIVQWSEATDSECDLSSFDSDGFTLSWTTNSSSAYTINYMALAGANLTDAFVKFWNTGTSNGDVAVSGVGFQPDCVLHLWSSVQSPPASEATATIAIGMMTAAAQVNLFCMSRDAQASGNSFSAQNTSYALRAFTTGGSTDWTAAYKSLDVDGFTTTIASTPASSFGVYSLCLKGGSFKLGSISSKSSTGNQATTGVGFQPEGVLFLSNFGATGTTGGIDLILTLGALDGAANRAIILNDNYGADPTDTAGYASAHALLVENSADQGAIDYSALYNAFGGDGFTLNWDVSAGQTTKTIHYLAFNGGAAPATGIPFVLMQGDGFRFQRAALGRF